MVAAVRRTGYQQAGPGSQRPDDAAQPALVQSGQMRGIPFNSCPEDMHMTTTFRTSLKTSALTTALALALSPAAHAADKMAATPDDSAYSDRANMKTWDVDREALQDALMKGQSVAAIKDKITSMGWKITATNDTEADYMEYEVVNGNASAEVQIDVDTATKMATKVDVASNLWRADSTKAALKGQPFTPMTGGDYSDRKYMKAWSGEKDMLEKALGNGQSLDVYRKKLADMGYQVTSINDREKDYCEYEVVKGRNSYEVQIDMDATTGRATKVDVASNMWASDATERALEATKR